MGVKLTGACCGVRGPLCCGAPPQGLCKAPHDPGMCWKQFMMCFLGLLGLWRYFILPPCTTRGRRSANAQLRSACAGARTTFSLQLLVLASKIARRSAISISELFFISAARCATARRLSSGVTLLSPRGCRTEGLPMAKGLPSVSRGVIPDLTKTHRGAQLENKYSKRAHSSIRGTRNQGLA